MAGLDGGTNFLSGGDPASVLAVALIPRFSRVARCRASAISAVDFDPLRLLHPASDLDRRRAVLRLGKGMPQTSAPIRRRRHSKARKQVIAQGPWPSQEVIKDAGDQWRRLFQRQFPRNPFENPNAITNFVQLVADFSIRRGADQCVRPDGRRPAPGLGHICRDGRGCSLAGVVIAYWPRAAGPIPPLPRCRSTRRQARCRAGGNMEGQGGFASASPNSALLPPVTTDASVRCGQHDARQPGCRSPALCRMVNIMLGEIIFGGGRLGDVTRMLLVRYSSPFSSAGLMVRPRTPEYLGKEDQRRRKSRWRCSPILILPGCRCLGFTAALATVLPDGLAGPANQGPHGFSEILYAFVSGDREQRQRLCRHPRPTRPSTTRPPGLAMFIGRFLMIIPMLAIARCARRQEDRPGLRPAPSRPMAGCSSALSSA